MPKTKFQDFVYTIIMVICMVYTIIETTQIYAHMYSEILMNAMQGHPMSKFKMEDALAFNC